MASLSHMSSPLKIGQSLSTKSLTYDPIEQFPYEIWQACFLLAISGTADGPLPYLAVSPKWNEMILHDSAFWTTIIIDDGEDQDARIYTFLYLSQALLINIEYRGSNGFPGVMDGCASRIQSILDSSGVYHKEPANLCRFLLVSAKLGHIPSYPEMRTLISTRHFYLGPFSYPTARLAPA